MFTLKSVLNSPEWYLYSLSFYLSCWCSSSQ